MSPRSRWHWTEYCLEAWGLGTFMVSAALFTSLLEHPSSPVHALISDGAARRSLVGLAMGLTCITIIYSPWGQRSGAHLNPATTLTFLRLGKIKPRDATSYILAQFVGGTAGVLLSKLLLGPILSHPSVSYLTTVPGSAGVWVAFIAEAVIAFGMMLMVLFVTNHPRLSPYTGLFAGLLVFVYITFEAPLSGMSINPARTVASALPSGVWTAIWIYFSAPIFGMLAAAQLYLRISPTATSACPKLHHGASQPCIFCGRGRLQPATSPDAEAHPSGRAPTLPL